MASARLAIFTILTSLTVARASVIPLHNGFNTYTPGNNRLKWSNCSVDSYPGRECTQFEVPLDWHDDAVGKASLAVIRYPATKSPKLGTLFMNPGGPGGEGVETVQGPFGDLIMQESGGQYDLISWDPRGVGKSTPHTRCFGTTEEGLAFWNGSFIRNGLEARGNFTRQVDLDEFYEQVDEVDDLLTRFGKQCMEFNSNAWKYIGTAATVRDMVAMHDLFEGSDKPINFWGISYGTLVGNVFVNMFPERVGRVVLDGVVNPTYYANRPSHEVYEINLHSTDEAFNGFAAACAQAGPSRCAIAEDNSTEASIAQWIRDLIDAAYDERRAKGPSSDYSSAAIRGAIFQGLYTPQTWSTLAQTLKAAADDIRNSSTTAHGDKRGIFDSLPRGPPDYKQTQVNETDADTFSYAAEAITCGDAEDMVDATTKDLFDFIVKVTRNVSHMFGPVSTKIPGTYCHRWPVRSVERYTGPWNKELANTILVIGNEADPITPYISAKYVADTLGDSAVLMEQDDYGHASLAMHSNCTASAIQKYFVHNKLPHKDEFCGTNQELFPNTGITKSTLRKH